MKALIVSLESFQKGDVPLEVQEYIKSQSVEPFIILDESSKIKCNEPCKTSKMSKRAQAVLKLNEVGERCILTGTFTSKSPVNAYNQMNFLKKGFFSESIYAFAEHHVIRRSLNSVRGARITLPQKDYEVIRKRLRKATDKVSFMNIYEGIHSYYGISYEDCVHIYKNEKYSPFKNVDELWQRIGDVCFHPAKEDILDVPPKNYQTYNVHLTEEQLKLYLQLQNQNCTDNITVDNGLKLFLRFQDICNGYEPVDTGEVNDKGNSIVELVPLKENPKLDCMEEIIESIGDEQVVIWCSRSKLLHDACQRMKDKGYTCGIYDGKVDEKAKLEAYNNFYNKTNQLIFINQASGGYGLDKLRNANYAIYLCNDASVERRQQSEDRIDRGEHEEQKFIYDITCKGTVEQRNTEALLLGKELLDTGITDASIFKYYGESA